MPLRSLGPGAEKANGGVYLWLKSDKVGAEEGHEKEGMEEREEGASYNLLSVQFLQGRQGPEARGYKEGEDKGSGGGRRRVLKKRLLNRNRAAAILEGR